MKVASLVCSWERNEPRSHKKGMKYVNNPDELGDLTFTDNLLSEIAKQLGRIVAKTTSDWIII